MQLIGIRTALVGAVAALVFACSAQGPGPEAESSVSAAVGGACEATCGNTCHVPATTNCGRLPPPCKAKAPVGPGGGEVCDPNENYEFATQGTVDPVTKCVNPSEPACVPMATPFHNCSETTSCPKFPYGGGCWPKGVKTTPANEQCTTDYKEYIDAINAFIQAQSAFQLVQGKIAVLTAEIIIIGTVKNLSCPGKNEAAQIVAELSDEQDALHIELKEKQCDMDNAWADIATAMLGVSKCLIKDCTGGTPDTPKISNGGCPSEEILTYNPATSTFTCQKLPDSALGKKVWDGCNCK